MNVSLCLSILSSNLAWGNVGSNQTEAKGNRKCLSTWEKRSLPLSLIY